MRAPGPQRGVVRGNHQQAFQVYAIVYSRGSIGPARSLSRDGTNRDDARWVWIPRHPRAPPISTRSDSRTAETRRLGWLGGRIIHANPQR